MQSDERTAFANTLALIPAVLPRLPVGLSDSQPAQTLDKLLVYSLINRVRGKGKQNAVGGWVQMVAKLDMTAFFGALAFQNYTTTLQDAERV